MEQDSLEANNGDQRRVGEKSREKVEKRKSKRMHVHTNPLKLAFKSWQNEPEPWNFKACRGILSGAT